MSIDNKNTAMKLICVCSIFFVISSCFCGCIYVDNNNLSKESIVDKLNNEVLDDVLSKIKDKQNPFFTELTYVSNDKVILNGNVGLIVYDLKNRKIIRAVYLTDINMTHVQGDDVSIFQADDDGEKILMYNSIFYFNSSDEEEKKKKRELEGRYLYDIKSDSLLKTDIDKIEKQYIIRKFNRENTDKNDFDYIDSVYIDDDTICDIAVPKNSYAISDLKIIISNIQGNERYIYDVF